MVLQLKLCCSRRYVLGEIKRIVLLNEKKENYYSVDIQYYALRAMKFRLPRWISMMITLLQLSQMVIGCWVNISAWQYKNNGEMCQVTEENLQVSFAMYTTYFILFAHFFLGSYIWKTKRTRNIESDQSKKKLS